MPERVIIEVEAPSSWRETGIVAEGFYVVEGNTLTMTYADGQPVRIDGELVQHTLAEGESAKKAAGRLTRTVRRALSGRAMKQEVFGRSINYPKMGYA